VFGLSVVGYRLCRKFEILQDPVGKDARSKVF